MQPLNTCHEGTTERGYASAPSNYVQQPALRLDPRFRALMTKPKAYQERAHVAGGEPTSFATGQAGADAILGSKFMRGRELRTTSKITNFTKVAPTTTHHMGAGTQRGYDLYYKPESHQKRTPEIIREIDHTLSFNRRRNPLWGNASVAPIPAEALRPEQFHNGCDCAAGGCAHQTHQAAHDTMGAAYKQSDYVPFFD